MSRAVFGNDRYTFAFGVDHTPMGTFLQIWDNRVPKDEFDSPHFEYDALFGPRGDSNPLVQSALQANTVLACRIKGLQQSWELGKEKKQTNLAVSHVVEFARALQLDPKKVERKAYELWD